MRKFYKIETNYRSTPEVLEVANAAIAANVHQFRKELVAARTSGVKPGLVPLGDSRQQALFVAQRILELRDEGMDLDEIAVLYRAHYHSMEVQMDLTRHGIPFQITSGLRFFEQAHVKDVAAFLKFAVNSRDEVAFKRMVRLLPGIGARSAEGLCGTKFARAVRTQLPAPAAESRRRTLHCRRWGHGLISKSLLLGRSRFRRRAASRGNNSCTRSRKLRRPVCLLRPRK